MPYRSIEDLSATPNTTPAAEPTLNAEDQVRMHTEAAQTILNELTLDEKISLLHQAAPGIERLGLAPFRTGTEGLHGLSWLGTATTLPQPIGLAATWDRDLLARAGDVVATEVRAKHAEDNSVSLNVWAPVVNSLRHPLWGRNEEGYSEDPLLTGDCAIAYSRGLKGLAGSAFWKTVPTLKHFLAYNNETDRAVTSSDMSARVLNEYEFPAFSRPLAAHVVGAVMPSYNLVNGRPNHVSKDLLDTLRTWAPQPISVVSDAGAPQNVITIERYYDNPTESHAALLTAGIDSFTDNDNNTEPTITALKEALTRGLIEESDISRAAFRLLYLRSLTGEFVANALVSDIYGQQTSQRATQPAQAQASQQAHDPYANIPASANDLPEHRAIALEAATKSVVLLKNENILPLSRQDTRIAVVGPLAQRTLHDWYSGTPPYLSTLGDALTDRYASGNVTVDDGADHIAIYSPASKRYLTLTEQGALIAAGSDQAAAETFSVTDWGHGINTLRAHSNDLLLSGGWIVNANATRVGGWVAQETFALHSHGDGTFSIKHIGSGKWLRSQQGSGLVSCESTDLSLAERFEFDVLSSGIERVRTATRTADVTIVAVGNDPHILGRETEDRPDLDLPRAARGLWRAVRANAPQAVLTVISSYPYALREIAGEADAILWSSHGGQELGRGLAAVISGDAEPYGRLAQEWVHDESCLPHLLDYDIINSGGTYWYNDCEPDFEFGFGLSYTTVEYSDVVLVSEIEPAGGASGTNPTGGVSGTNPTGAPTHAPTHARVQVTNTGTRTAQELVAVYTALEFPSTPLNSPAPLRRLAGYERVAIPSGGSVTVTVPLYSEAFQLWDVRNERMQVQPGSYTVWAGTSRTALASATWEVDATEFGAPFALAGATLRADQFDAHNYIVHSDADRTGATCVAVAPGHGEAYVEFYNVSAVEVAAVTVRIACDRALDASGGFVSVDLRGAESASVRSAQVRLARIEGSQLPADRYEWTDVTVPLMASGDAVAQGASSVGTQGASSAGAQSASRAIGDYTGFDTLRVTLSGNVRVQAISFA